MHEVSYDYDLLVLVHLFKVHLKYLQS
uniref:Uncharacterized protein n=1 Tax=Arundo donax TaxID=35708 RepID=A0A0A8YZN7_ARUDO